jgi:hypothetical protein
MMKTYMIGILVILTVVVLGCNLSKFGIGGGSAEYSSEADNFSIAFPGGSSGVETSDAKGGKYTGQGKAYAKSFDNRSDNYRSYEVQAFKIATAPTSDDDRRTTLLFGLNGWDDEPGTVVKDVTINGQKAIDSIRTVEIGPAKMSFREVVFYSDADKKLYVLQIAAVKKENLTANEGNDFVNSFKLKSDGSKNR